MKSTSKPPQINKPHSSYEQQQLYFTKQKQDSSIKMKRINLKNIETKKAPVDIMKLRLLIVEHVQLSFKLFFFFACWCSFTRIREITNAICVFSLFVCKLFYCVQIENAVNGIKITSLFSIKGIGIGISLYYIFEQQPSFGIESSEVDLFFILCFEYLFVICASWFFFFPSPHFSVDLCFYFAAFSRH